MNHTNQSIYYKMKNISIIITILITVFTTKVADAQIWKKIQKKAENQIVKKADKRIDEVLNGKKEEKKEKKKKEKNKPIIGSTEKTENPDSENPTFTENPKIWNKYDFVAADKIFFYDELKFEEYGEFPSKWDLAFGNAEVAKLGAEKVTQFKNGKNGTAIFPLITKKDYIEGYTTIEFDIYLDEEFYNYIFAKWQLGFYDISKESQISSNYYMDGDGIEQYNKEVGGKIKIRTSNNEISVSMGDKYNRKIAVNELSNHIGWHHIAIAIKGKNFKLYLDEHKMLNIPNIKFNPFKFYISADGQDTSKMLIKNVKIAEGGGSIYKGMSIDGKYVTNGILFDSNKATLKSQSYGILKKIVDVMNDNPDWNFQIIGHTDNDGDTKNNLKLSQQRAEAVKSALIHKPRYR